MPDMDIGFRLAQARNNAGLTQQEVCDRLSGLNNTQTLSAYERAVNDPPIDRLKEFSDLYHVSIDWIIRGEESPFTRQRDITDDIFDLFCIADRLGLLFVEDADFNGHPNGEYSIVLKNSGRRGFNELISNLNKLSNIRGVLSDVRGDTGYWALIREAIQDAARKSSNFIELSQVIDVSDDLGDLDDEDDLDLPF